MSKKQIPQIKYNMLVLEDVVTYRSEEGINALYKFSTDLELVHGEHDVQSLTFYAVMGRHGVARSITAVINWKSGRKSVRDVYYLSEVGLAVQDKICQILAQNI